MIFSLLACAVGCWATLKAARQSFRLLTGALEGTERVVRTAFWALASLPKVLYALHYPPGCGDYTGPPTLWQHYWWLVRLGPLWQLFAPGSFLRVYGIVAVPALAVIGISILSILVHLVGPLLQLFRAARRPLACGGLALGALLIIDDALRRYYVVDRPWTAMMRCGLAGIWALGAALHCLPQDHKELKAGLAALRKTAHAGAAALGSGTATFLLARGAVAAATASAGAGAGAAAAGGGAAAPLGAASYLLWGCSTALLSAEAWGMLLGFDAASTLALYAVEVGGWAWHSFVKPGVRSAAGAVRFCYKDVLKPAASALFRCDQHLASGAVRLGRRTAGLVRACVIRPAAATARFLGRVVRGCWNLSRVLVLQPTWQASKWVYRRLLVPCACAVSYVVRRLYGGACAAANAFWRITKPIIVAILKAVAKAAVWMALRSADTADLVAALAKKLCRVAAEASKATARATWRLSVRTWRASRPARVALLQAARLLWRTWRRCVAPLLWPGGSALCTFWLAQQVVLQGRVVPFGLAAVASLATTALMAGKELRKIGPLAGMGSRLERVGAQAYLHLDLWAVEGAVLLGRLVWPYARAAWRLTHGLLAWIAVLAGQCLSAMTKALLLVLTRGVVMLWTHVLGPPVLLVGRAVAACVRHVWKHPELSLLLAVGMLGATYAAHVSGAGAALASALLALCTACVRLVFGGAALLTSAVRHLLYAVACVLGMATGPVGAGAVQSVRLAGAASSTLAAWGGRAASDVSQVFASASFGHTLYLLHVAHSLLLSKLAVPELSVQGDVGRAAVTPLVSFMARSTGKVVLGPLYVAALLSLLAGPQWGRYVARFASFTPLTWLAYLVVVWVEGRHRLYGEGSSDFGTAMRSVRQQVAQQRAAQRQRAAQQAADGATISGLPQAAAAATAAAGGAGTVQPVAACHEEHPLLAQLRCQPAPVHVYDTPSCIICFGDLDMQRRDHQHGADQSLSPSLATAAAAKAGGAAAASRVDGDKRASGGAGAGQDENDDDEVCLVLRCGHPYHRGCILMALERNPRCPVCRELAIGNRRHTNVLF